MKPIQPYQPLILRILHGLNGLFLIAAILTAFWTYDTYDGRWGRIPLPAYKEIEGIHGTFGVLVLLIFPAFVIYAFHRGSQRLVQSDSLAKLAKVGQPIWWYTLNRFTNTLTLLALTFALVSGKLMDETWLPKGELNHFWYSAHLISWGVMVVAIALHLLMNTRVGGMSLLLSMLNWRFRAKDSPVLWSTHLLNGWSNLRSGAWKTWFQPPSMLIKLEMLIFISLAFGWIVSGFKELLKS
ncbi:MAG: cytochrome b/b6 domain-containing protein [Cyanobacteria bacterium J06635_1]